MVAQRCWSKEAKRVAKRGRDLSRSRVLRPFARAAYAISHCIFRHAPGIQVPMDDVPARSRTPTFVTTDFRHIGILRLGVIHNYNSNPCRGLERRSQMEAFEKVVYEALYDVMEQVWQQTEAEHAAPQPQTDFE